jgi:hypothetical protein
MARELLFLAIIIMVPNYRTPVGIVVHRARYADAKGRPDGFIAGRAWDDTRDRHSASRHGRWGVSPSTL